MEREILSIDIGATKTKIARMTGDGLSVFYHQPTSQDPEEQLSLMIRGIRKAGLDGGLSSIGIGCPGPLDPKAGIILSPPNLKAWDEFPLAARLKAEFGVPVHIENDATLGALGEAFAGGERPVENLFYMTVSTGIGIGIVHDGRIISGARGLAGECWSFVPAHFFDDLMEDSALMIPGTNINAAAGNGMVPWAREQLAAGVESLIPENDVTTYTIIDAWKRGDALAQRVLERARTTLAACLAFTVTLLDPELIVLGGGLCHEEEWIVAPVRDKFMRMLPEGIGAGIKIRRAKLWDEAVLYGAYRYAGTGRS